MRAIPWLPNRAIQIYSTACLGAGALLVIVNLVCLDNIVEILGRHAQAVDPRRAPLLVEAYRTYLAHFGSLLIALGLATILLPRLISLVAAWTGRRPPLNKESVLLACIVFNVFSILFAINAYVCDDAFITFRTVDNFVQGHGLRWNTIERVQTFTNPLWLLLVSLFYGLFLGIGDLNNLGKLYIIALSLSYAFSLSALLLLCTYLVRIRRTLIALGALLVLMSSRAFVDFTSSGLETPLTYFLITLFFVHLYDRWDRPDPVNAAVCFLIAALIFVNRQSTIALTIIPCIALFWRTARACSLKEAIAASAVGWFPAFAWIAFAFTYYGFPFPNTYYAKLELGIPLTVAQQSVNHVFQILKTDPITIVTIFLSIAVFALRRNRLSLIGASLFLHLLYVMNTGGDFMGGRYFSSAFLISVVGLSFLLPESYGQRSPEEKASPRHPRSAIVWPAFLLGLILYNLLVPWSPIKEPFHVLFPRDTKVSGAPLFGLENALQYIYLEKAAYYTASNPLFYRKGGFPFGVFRFNILRNLEHCISLGNEDVVALVGDGGVHGFCRGPRTHLISPLSVTDPLIARLPVPDLSTGFWPGHFKKKVPEGLVESYIADENLVADPRLHAYNEKLRAVTQGPLFSQKRWRSIWELNFKQRKYDQPYY